MWIAPSRMSSTPAGSACRAYSTTSGASAPKSRGMAWKVQRAIACGFVSNRSNNALSRSVQAMRPSQAHKTRRTASQPSQAPLPSSETGKPQPPIRIRLSPSSTQPIVPVPMTMTPPSRPPCAPTQAACASAVTIVRPKGKTCDCAKARSSGSVAPASARHAVIRGRSSVERPAWRRHSRAAWRIEARLFSSPRRMLAGPAKPSPEPGPRRGAEARAAFCSAAIDAEKERICLHSLFIHAGFSAKRATTILV